MACWPRSIFFLIINYYYYFCLLLYPKVRFFKPVGPITKQGIKSESMRSDPNQTGLSGLDGRNLIYIFSSWAQRA